MNPAAGSLRAQIRRRLHEVGAPVDLTGHRYGMLVVVSQTEMRHRRAVVWECLCDCGETTRVSATLLGKRKSCGCLSGKPSKSATPEEPASAEPFPPSHRDPEFFDPIEQAIAAGWGDAPWVLIMRAMADNGGVLPQRSEA